MHRVAVIGAGGFVGRHLIAHLQSRGRQVAGVSRGDRAAGLNGGEWLSADVHQDPDGLVDFLARFQPDTVVHLAATSFEPHAAARPWDVLQNNLWSTLTVLSACRRLSPVPRCVVVSSGAVYGRQPDSSAIVETADLHPLTTYGVSKVAVEALVRQHWDAFQFPAIVVRPFNLTGPGEHAVFVTSAFARQVALIEAGRQRLVIRVGDLATTRDFTDVRDVAAGLGLAAERGVPGEVYNLCSGVGTAISDLVRRLLQATATPIDIESDSTLMRTVEIQAQRGDSTKLRRATGWEPRIDLDRALADVLDDWRTRIQGAEG